MLVEPELDRCSVDSMIKSIVQDRPFMRGSSVNPKAEILQMGYDPDKGVVYCEVSEPLFLATHQHPYAIASSDHQMHLARIL